MHTITTDGYLGKDPEERFTSGGKKLITFSLGAKVGKDKTLWYDCNIWEEKIAQFQHILPYLKKGSSVIIIGELGIPETYKNKNNETIVKNKIQPLSIYFGMKSEKKEQSVSEECGPNSILF